MSIIVQEKEFIYEEYVDGSEQILLEFVTSLRNNKEVINKVISDLKFIENFVGSWTTEQRGEMSKLGESTIHLNEFSESYVKSLKDLASALKL